MGGVKISFAEREDAEIKQAPRQLIETGQDMTNSSHLYWKRMELFISLNIRWPISSALSAFFAINSSCCFGSDSTMAAILFKTDSVNRFKKPRQAPEAVVQGDVRD